MTRRDLLALAVAGLVAGSPLRASGDEALRVTSLAKDGHVYVSFSLVNGLTEELRRAIGSGLPATITYTVELRRPESLWFDRTVASVTVTATVRFDNLTRQHQLVRTIDGRGEEPRVTEDEDVVRWWLTEFDRLPLFTAADLEANTEYYVRVRAQSRPRVNPVFFWPWGGGGKTGYTPRFTFIR
jgi:hypothetical protein